MKRAGILLLSQVLLLLCTVRLSAQDDLLVLKDKWLQYGDASNSLYRHLTEEAYSFLDARDNKVLSIKTAEEWKERQNFIRETLLDIVGPFPAKSPLNAKTVKTIVKSGYRVEHIIYESQPGFYVTSSLFVPSGLKKGARLPAIIYCSGHSADGYRSAAYQHVIINLVNKGFIVFAFDPVGQGERLEYFDPKTGRSSVGGPTKEHSYPGAQAFLTGSSQAMYMIWDGIRAVDYLLTRSEVDPARLGITGRSGGGTQSAYIAAMDDRIFAAAPENYITSYRRLLQTIGPQDAEQNLFNILSRGLDHPDFLIVRAPKPALMITTTNDMFSIQGAMETERQVSRIYKSFGKPQNFSRCEDLAGHASTQKNREAMYSFFSRHLSNPCDTTDKKYEFLSPDELKVTSTGQVSASLMGETVFSLNRKRAEEIEKRLNEQRGNPAFLTEALGAARLLSGYLDPEVPSRPVYSGVVARDGYVIGKYIIFGEGSYVIPYLLFTPPSTPEEAVIWLNPSGKAADSAPGGRIDSLVRSGKMVLVPDLIGTGETGPGMLKGDAYFENVSHNLWYAAMISGRSIAGIRAGDVVRLAMVLREYYGITEIHGYAVGEMSPVLLHAAAFSPLIREVNLSNPVPSWNSLVKERYYSPSRIMNAVPGALEKYDLPDLEKALSVKIK